MPHLAAAAYCMLILFSCKSPDYHPPHGQAQYNATSPFFTMPMDALLIGGKGHLHDGGVNIELLRNSSVICDSRAVYGGTGSEGVAPNGRPWETIHEMSQCRDRVKLKKGDVLTVKAVYDTTQHPL
jgi:hypothetical protein